MDVTPLASSRKVWKAIQHIMGRALLGNLHNQIGTDAESLSFSPNNSNTSPWYPTRDGNVIRFNTGIVGGSIQSGVRLNVITDAGGYTYVPTTEGGTPIYLYVKMRVFSGTPFALKTGDATDNVTEIWSPVDYFSEAALGDVTYTPPPGMPYRYYYAGPTVPREDQILTFDPPSAPSNEYAYVPFLYINDTQTIQLLTKNITLNAMGACRNITLWL